MRVVRSAAIAVILLGIVAIAPTRSAAAGTKHSTIFVSNGDDVTAYPTGSRGDVAPIALTADMAYPDSIARDAGGRIYVANFDTNTVTVYAASANGNVTPIAVIGGPNTRLANPTGIALDASGKIYVVNGEEYRNGSITIYPPLATSTGILNEAPIATVAGSKTLLDNPTGIALDSQGKMYVANDLHVPVKQDKSFDRGRLTVYPAGSSGNIAPIATISGAKTGLALPRGITLDSDDNIYVANQYTANSGSDLKYYGSITIYPAGSKGDAPPMAIIAGDNTGLYFPQGIALDSRRNLYVTDDSVNVYPAGSNGNVAPAASITGADTGLVGPIGIALDSSGSLYVLNSFGGTAQRGSVTVYPAGSSGDTAPNATLTSNFTGLGSAVGIAVDATGTIYVPYDLGGVGEHGSIAIYPAGGYATGPPIATIAGDNTGLDYPSRIAVDSIGNIIVLNSGNAITEYPAGSVGDVMPSTTLNIDPSGKNYPIGIAVDRRDDLYVANQGGEKCNKRSCVQTSPDSVAVYPTGSDGNAKPSAVISGANTNLASPSAVAVDHSGEIYVTNEGPVKCTRGCGRCIGIPAGPGSISVYAPGSNGDAAPTATISGPNTGLRFPYEIALDSNGNIYVLNSPRIGFICVGIVKTNEQAAIKKDVHASGSFEDASTGPILIFAAGSHGDVAPIGIIGGPLTGLDFYGSSGIAIGPDGQ
jgi:sugar lactone lactonase YvrE